MASQPYNQQRPTYLPNGGPVSGPAPGAVPLLPNQGRVIQSGSTRVLCIADVRGNMRSLNELAAEARASHVIHTGDFGFYDENSLTRIAEKTLKHVIQYSPLLSDNLKRTIAQVPSQQSIKDRYPRDQLHLSELPLFLNGTYKLNIPVYTVWGACEDVQVLEKLCSGEYKVDNLHIIDEAHSRLLDVGGVKLRLLGLGGAVVMHKLFDNGEGRTTIAGGQGTMWTTLLQMGELVDTATRVYDPTETRVFVTHASPAREGLLNQLTVALKADFSISAGLHFRYGSSYNEFSVNPSLDHYRGKLAASKASFNDVWETVKNEVEPAVKENEPQSRLLQHALDIVTKMPTVANGGNPFGGLASPGSGQVDESAFKNMWNFNLADAAYGWLVLDIENGRIGTEMRAQGFNFSHRGGKAALNQVQQSSTIPAPPQPSAAPATDLPVRPQQARATPPSGPQPFPPGPRSQPPTQPQINRGPGPMANRAGPTPAPVPTAPKEAPKPATPQPIATGPSNDKPGEVKVNGAASAEKPAGTPIEPAKSVALYMRNTKDEDEARSLVPEDDKSKIVRVERQGAAHIVVFNSNEEMLSVYSRVPRDLKGPPSAHRAPDKSSVAVYQERRGMGFGNARGGNQGYRSGGGASDSEGGRGGRQGFGGRGRGGSQRSERIGRGGRGGRGGYGKSDGGAASSTPVPAPAPAAAATTTTAAAAAGGGDS